MKYFRSVRPKPKKCTSETAKTYQYQTEYKRSDCIHCSFPSVWSLLQTNLYQFPSETLTLQRNFDRNTSNLKIALFLRTSETDRFSHIVTLTKNGIIMKFSEFILLPEMLEKHGLKIKQL